jgi:aryl-alcohol dehydrogenase-like predicted oxidoreductase
VRVHASTHDGVIGRSAAEFIEEREETMATRDDARNSSTNRRPAGVDRPAVHSGTFSIGGTLSVYRMGFGTMRLPGPGVWGEPADRAEAIAVLRQTVELGINLLDTADSYGPYVAEDLIREALHPYPAGLVIATKAGLVRTRAYDAPWIPLGRPEYLRQECEMSLRRLKLETIDLFQLHRIDPRVPPEDQFGLLRDLQKEGKVRYLGLSEVKVAEIEAARHIVPIATVQNNYNLVNRKHEDVLDYCTRESIGFIPFFPLATGALAKPGGPLPPHQAQSGLAGNPVQRAAERLGAKPAQIALAWLLKKSPIMLPIPGTSKVKHLEENTRAALLQLDDATMEELEQAGNSGAGRPSKAA